MRLFNNPNSVGMSDRERTFFSTSFFNNGIFDLKMSSSLDPGDSVDNPDGTESMPSGPVDGGDVSYSSVAGQRMVFIKELINFMHHTNRRY